jgi:hypothetical protein
MANFIGSVWMRTARRGPLTVCQWLGLITGLLTLIAAAPDAGTADLAVRGRTNANSSITSFDRYVAVAWAASAGDGTTDIYAAVSRNGGRAFGRPTRVNGAASLASLSGEQPPQVSFIPQPGREPAIVVVWTAKAPGGTRLLSARSSDAGRSFTRPTPLPGSDAAGNRGWEAMTAGRDAHVAVIWLDHREMAPASSDGSATHAGHQHGASASDGMARAQLSKLFFARLDLPSSARAIASGVCYCCKTAIASGRDGSIYAAWRQVYAGNVRDIAFTVSHDGGRSFATPIRVSEDHWVLDGCPENGPAIAVEDSGRVHVVWPTLVPGAPRGAEPTLALFYAASSDGRRFSPRQQVPTEGVPSHPRVALGRSGPIVTWEEQGGGQRHIAIARGAMDPQGTVRFIRQPAGDAAPATYPVLAVSDGGLVLAWTSGSASNKVIRTERLPD